MSPVYLFSGGLLFPCFQLLSVRKLMHAFFRQPYRTPLRYVSWIAYYILLAMVQLGVNILPPVLLLLNLLFLFITCTFSYRSSTGSRCVFSILLIAVWMLVEVVVGISLSLFGMEGWGLKTAGVAISNMCMFIVSVIVDHYSKGKNRPELSIQYVAAVTLIPVGTIYLMHNIFYIMAEHVEYTMFAISASFLLLLLNYIALEVYEKITMDSGAQERLLLYEQELELMSRQTEEREAYDRQIRRMRHDMKNHMTGLLGMLHEDNIEQAEEYIRCLLKENICHRPQDVSRSGNVVVDAIVNNKCDQALSEDMKFDAKVFLPVSLPFQAGHLAIVFGNLLDNALEACREIGDGKRWINLEAIYTKDVLMLTVSNSCKNREKSIEGKFFTTKVDRHNHGLGLSSVEQAVETYNGQLETDYNNEVFHAVVVMYGGK